MKQKQFTYRWFDVVVVITGLHFLYSESQWQDTLHISDGFMIIPWILFYVPFIAVPFALYSGVRLLKHKRLLGLTTLSVILGHVSWSFISFGSDIFKESGLIATSVFLGLILYHIWSVDEWNLTFKRTVTAMIGVLSVLALVSSDDVHNIPRTVSIKAESFVGEKITKVAPKQYKSGQETMVVPNRYVITTETGLEYVIEADTKHDWFGLRRFVELEPITQFGRRLNDKDTMKTEALIRKEMKDDHANMQNLQNRFQVALDSINARSETLKATMRPVDNYIIAIDKRDRVTYFPMIVINLEARDGADINSSEFFRFYNLKNDMNILRSINLQGIRDGGYVIHVDYYQDTRIYIEVENGRLAHIHEMWETDNDINEDNFFTAVLGTDL